MKIIIETIPHENQRYSTTGDWMIKEDTFVILVSELGDWKYNSLIAIHELVEMLLCKDHGVTQEEVDQFDISHPELDEPGDSPDAPYGKEHRIADIVERLVASQMNLSWDEYEKVIDKLYLAK